MIAELWLVKPCEKHGMNCSRLPRVRLDPNKVVFRGFEVKPEHVGKTLLHAFVQDVIDALEEE